MIVYGDHPRLTTLAALHARAVAAHARSSAAPPGLARHSALVATFLAWAELTRARADADFAEHRRDHATPEGAAMMATLVRLARAVAVSWRSGFRRTPLLPLGPAPSDRPAQTKAAEGFAFYALYPEAALEAAARLAPARDTLIVGLRGVGVALAAMAAAALRPRIAPITLRPTGHPFARRIDADPPPSAARALVVDEGPGLSGSSFAAAVDCLEKGGIPAERVTLLPSHPHPPGAMAPDRARQFWTICARAPADFDSMILPRLREWVGEVVGDEVTAWEDVSGGRWATAPPPSLRGTSPSGRGFGEADGGGWRGPLPPIDPPRERRKFLASTRHARYFVKFAGLGDIGHAKLARARSLAAAHLVPEPIGLAHGFLVERWIDPGPPAPPTATELTRYLAARTQLRPPNPGAPLAALIAMAHANIAEALGPYAAIAFAERADADALHSRPTATDNRLHAWEWLRDSDGHLLKADALDHCEAHDLIGCQDIAWDIAGAAVELGLDPAPLTQALAADPRLVSLHTLLYPAFQLGLWTMAGHPRADFYAAHLQAAFTSSEPPRAATGR